MKLHVAMSLRMQLRRIVIMIITEYPVPSLARNYPCKEYQIMYESVHIYLCTCRRNKYPCKSAFVWNVHIQVMLTLISFLILNIGQFSTLTICPDINGFQIPLKTSCTDTDDVKQKTSLFSVQGKSAWYCFKAVVLLFYVICVRYTN